MMQEPACWALAVHSWNGKVDGNTVKIGQLVFQKDDLIRVLEQRDEWWRGHLAANSPDTKGWFPSEYVVETEAPEMTAAEPPPAPPPPPLKLEMLSKEERRAAFDRMDVNGNGGLSLAEIDKAIVEVYPQFDQKPALIRAYKAADRDGSGFITRKEFGKLLHFLGYFTDLWHNFEKIDTDHDRRLDLTEFMGASALVGHAMSEEEAVSEFRNMDEDGGGFVLFDEFCVWCAHRHLGDGFEDEDEDAVDQSAHYQVPGSRAKEQHKRGVASYAY